MPGPVPKRSDQRRRRNKPEVGVVSIAASSKVEPPETPAGWHPLVAGWFDSLKKSAQSQFFEPSDWQVGLLAGEVMSRELMEEGQVRAATWAEFNSVAGNLLSTEGQRRRLRIELARAGDSSDGDVTVSVIEEYRRMLG